MRGVHLGLAVWQGMRGVPHSCSCSHALTCEFRNMSMHHEMEPPATHRNRCQQVLQAELGSISIFWMTIGTIGGQFNPITT